MAERDAGTLGLSLGVEQDVAPLGGRNGQPAHHHRKHRPRRHPHPVALGERAHGLERDRGIRTAKRRVELELELGTVEEPLGSGRQAALDNAVAISLLTKTGSELSRN